MQKYEKSKSYKGENSVRQSFAVEPSKIFAQYEDDFADVDEVKNFEQEAALLQQEGFVEIVCSGNRIAKILAVDTENAWNQIRDILGVKEKKVLQQEALDFYASCLEKHAVISCFCKAQIERINQGKKESYPLDTAKVIVKFLDYILNNQQEILERELSIEVAHDSKLWERSYRSQVCKILCESGTFDELASQELDPKEFEKKILEELNVYPNPSYVHFKGNAKIVFDNGDVVNVLRERPLALPSTALKTITKIEISENVLMTVENLTSFNRVQHDDTFFVYLSGYHNTAKRNFIRLVQQQNASLEFYHFGDIDPDGFLILENLKLKTGIDFKPYCMSVDQLKQYEKYCKPLVENDRIKANGLIKSGKYVEIAQYMQDNNVKLEQEIISWNER
ncbi:Wadjet anti-phage system protein JetD domain-containing protein [Fibrobacter sp. UWEL]|uniref:Wadjet anti-phage system protein JetD domain-containing protein n=1 Tax=Fibrobacter sp. UWEL TaxID=1896209 RepID=UPI0013567175|nr:Wadjet anti-phage system protein JetD domain-containing protein [Fibrobacter sp. UWEL]